MGEWTRGIGTDALFSIFFLDKIIDQINDYIFLIYIKNYNILIYYILKYYFKKKINKL